LTSLFCFAPDTIVRTFAKAGNMSLDLTTLVFISAVIPIVMGILLLIYMMQRKVYAGFGHWVLANFMLSGSFFLTYTRELGAPIFVSHILGNAMGIYTEILVYEGAQLFFGRRAFSRLNYTILLVYIIVQVYLLYIFPDINLRVVWLSIMVTIVMFRVAFAFWNSTIPELTNASRTMTFMVMISTTVAIFRAIYTLQLEQPVQLLQETTNIWLSIVGFLGTIIWAFYYFFLTSARLELELNQARADMAQLATTDALTGMYNRRHFMEYSSIEFERAVRDQQPLSVIFLDMDNLKTINDRYGHEAGDTVLSCLAEIILSEIRPYDIAARLGGDEFVILLPNINIDQATLIAERIRIKAAQTVLNISIDPINISLSLGVASSSENTLDIKHVLAHADTALYKAKNDGRNRVVMYESHLFNS
jgi:diguanylate cyclase (GGDEF)-like protein